MKAFTVSLFGALAAASPVVVRAPANTIVAADPIVVEAIQNAYAGTTSNDLENGKAGACPEAILIFARGTSEAGNLGPIAGEPLADAVQKFYGAANVWVQGVGLPYTAGLFDNLLPGGTSQAGIGEGVRLFNEANTKCPNTRVVAGGYSQGAALMAGAIPKLSATVRNQIKGVVLFGYTQDQQNNGGIPSYPQKELDVFCAQGDLVCNGTLTITPAHLSYAPIAAGPGAAFIESILGPA